MLAENDNTPQEKKKRKDIKKLAVIAVLVVITLTASGFFLLQYVNPDETIGENDAEVEEEPIEDIGPTFEIGDFTVNFNDRDQIKYLKASIVFEIDDEAVVGEMEDRKPQIRDLIITTLRSQSLEDFKEPGTKKIKNSIQEQINNTLKNGEIVSVWFTDLIIQ